MIEVNHLKTLIIEAVNNVHDTELLDLILKLLIAEG